jgi:hypothetical protein
MYFRLAQNSASVMQCLRSVYKRLRMYFRLAQNSASVMQCLRSVLCSDARFGSYALSLFHLAVRNTLF